jgi:hypothetical protein
MADGTLARGTIVAAIQLGPPAAGLEKRHDGGSKSKKRRKIA